MMQAERWEFWLQNPGEHTCYNAYLTPVCQRDSGSRKRKVQNVCWKAKKFLHSFKNSRDTLSDSNSIYGVGARGTPVIKM